jgi:chemotaxis signal transduction protein
MIETQTAPIAAPIAAQTLLADRFILTEVERFTLVFPAVWVAEIFRIDRSQILDLPFYDSLMMGIVHHNGQIIPLVAASRLLKVDKFVGRERLVVIKLDRTAGKLANIGVIVDRAIGTSNRQDLPPELFIDSTTIDQMLMIHPDLIPTDLWQPRN